MMPTAISMCEPKVIGISVKTLYEQYGDTLTMGFIEKWKEDGKTYYDLYNSDGDPFMNQLEALTSGSSSAMEAGLLVMAFTGAEIARTK